MISLINIELIYHTQTAGHFLFVTSLLRREIGSVYYMTVPNMVVTKKTLMLVINVFRLKYSNRVIGITSLERLFPSSIADTMN